MIVIFYSSIIIILDQITKFIIRNNLSLYQRVKIIEDYFYFTFVKNTGAAFGILKNQRLFFIIVTILFIIFLTYFYQKKFKKSLLTKSAVIFLLGGSTANLIDRIIFHYVTDFIAVDLFSFYKFPVINIADIFIFLGMLILIFNLSRSTLFDQN